MLVYWESTVWSIIANGILYYVKYKNIYQTKPTILNCRLSLPSPSIMAMMFMYGDPDGVNVVCNCVWIAASSIQESYMGGLSPNNQTFTLINPIPPPPHPQRFNWFVKGVCPDKRVMPLSCYPLLATERPILYISSLSKPIQQPLYDFLGPQQSVVQTDYQFDLIQSVLRLLLLAN